MPTTEVKNSYEHGETWYELAALQRMHIRVIRLEALAVGVRSNSKLKP